MVIMEAINVAKYKNFKDNFVISKFFQSIFWSQVKYILISTKI